MTDEGFNKKMTELERMTDCRDYWRDEVAIQRGKYEELKEDVEHFFKNQKKLFRCFDEE